MLKLKALKKAPPAVSGAALPFQEDLNEPSQMRE
jgi:hypothetical protein